MRRTAGLAALAVAAATAAALPMTTASSAQGAPAAAPTSARADVAADALRALQRHPGAEKGYHYDVRVVRSADGGATWSEPLTVGGGVSIE